MSLMVKINNMDNPFSLSQPIPPDYKVTNASTNFMQLGESHCLGCHETCTTIDHRCPSINKPSFCTEDCGKWFKSVCNHIMVDIGKYERECKFCKLKELTAK